MRRVVITGIGAVTPLGMGRTGLWQGICRERSAVGPLTHFDACELPTRIAAEVRGFEPSDYMDAKSCRRLDRCAQFAVAASRMALEDACLVSGDWEPERAGVCIGSALGGAGFAEEQHIAYLREGGRAVSPYLALQMFVGASSCNVAIEFDLRGFTTSNADSCASGPIAIGNALHAIRRGDADVMLAGGTEAPLAPLCFGAFAFIHAMSRRNDDPERASRPFDADRDGFVMGEGAAILVLEERERAIARGARIYAEIAGFASANDAHHMTAPRPDAASATACMRNALRSANMEPHTIDYINAHGSSTRLNDSTETRALKNVFGDLITGANPIPISGTKAMHGHALGATGAIEAAICCLAMQHNHIPPTVNLTVRDPECDLNYTPHTGRPADLRAVLSNSFGFGGINAALVLRRDSLD